MTAAACIVRRLCLGTEEWVSATATAAWQHLDQAVVLQVSVLEAWAHDLMLVAAAADTCCMACGSLSWLWV